MATTEESLNLAATPTEKQRPSLGGIRFDWIVTILCTVLVSGIYLDGWAHFHGKVDQSFFTPWHAALYSGFVVAAAFLFLSFIRNRMKGSPWRESLPAGYGVSLLGAVIFGVGGVLDLIWHTLFGIEQSVDALLSPTHLILALGVVLIVTGPLRAAWIRFPRATGYGWLKLLPTVLSVTLILSIFTFFTEYAHPLVNTWAANSMHAAGHTTVAPFFSQSLGITSILFQAALLMALVLLLLRRWTLPFGSLTLIFTLNATFMSVLTDHYALVLAALVAGLIADVLVWRFKPSLTRLVEFRIVAFAIPAIFYGLYFLDLLLTNGIGWSINLWMGSIVLSGIIGLLLSYLLLPPLSAVTNEG